MARFTTSKQRVIVPDIQTVAKFAGIDFHKLFCMVTLGDADGNVIFQDRVLCNSEDVTRFFSPFTNLQCAIENCRANEWFVELLKSLDCTVFVANTYAVKLITESSRKTDKIDSRVLMQLLAKDFLPLCYQPTKEERIIKERLKYRIHVVNSRTQYINKAHALLDKENLGAKLRSKKRRLQAISENLSFEREQLFTKYCKLIDEFDTAVLAEDRWVAKTVRENPDAVRVMTTPGVGEVTALTFIAEIGDVTRFSRACSVSAYFGLIPRLYASSDTRHLGSITKKGSRTMRRLLVQAAWAAIRRSPELKSKYANIMKRRGKKVAIIAIARKLAEISFRILRDKTVFDPTQLT